MFSCCFFLRNSGEVPERITSHTSNLLFLCITLINQWNASSYSKELWMMFTVGSIVLGICHNTLFIMNNWLNNSLFHPSEIKILVQASTVGWKPPLFIAVQKSSSSPISTLSRGTMIETCWSPLGGWLISSQSDEKFILPGSAYLELPAKPHYIFWKNSTLIFVFSSEDTDGASTAGIYFFFK